MAKRIRVRDKEKAREYQRRFREKNRQKIRARDRSRHARYGRGRIFREPRSLAELCAALRWGRLAPHASKREAAQVAMRAHEDFLLVLLAS